MSWLAFVNPGFVLVLGGLVALLIKDKRVRGPLTVIVPLLGLGVLLFGGAPWSTDLDVFPVLGFELVLYRIDSLSFIFGLAFLLASLINAIYALHTDNRVQDGAALAYAGAAVAATFAGDLMTFFIFWELTAVTSVFLILQAGTRAAYWAGMRYLGIQILSGVLLLDGAVYMYKETGGLHLPEIIGQGLTLDDPGAVLMLIAIGIKAAFPFLHNWLQDSYPKATPVGAVVLSAFTTKLAVYALARLFPGVDILIWIGAVMTVFPVFFAVVENDLRKVLAYSLNNQVGFMVCAIGLASATTPYGQLALNGAAAHAFAHIIYKGLLFMGIGAVLYRTGTAKATELGGLWRSMPYTTVFTIIGAVSISAFPLLSGFAAKSLTMSAVGGAHMAVVYLMLLFASAGVLEHSGIKIPYFAFFGHDSGKRVEEAPFNMLLAMGLASALCLFIGLPALFTGFGYQWLYALTPLSDAALDYGPKLFTAGHLVEQMQLLLFAVLAFVLLKRFGLYPGEKRAQVLDTDWLYRRLGAGFLGWSGTVWNKASPATGRGIGALAERVGARMEAAFSPRGTLSRGGLSGAMGLWTAAVLGVVLVISFAV